MKVSVAAAGRRRSKTGDDDEAHPEHGVDLRWRNQTQPIQAKGAGTAMPVATKMPANLEGNEEEDDREEIEEEPWGRP